MIGLEAENVVNTQGLVFYVVVEMSSFTVSLAGGQGQPEYRYPGNYQLQLT